MSTGILDVICGPGEVTREELDMTLDGLKHWHGARPFVPFVMRLTDGRSVPVRHPEFLSHSPSGRWLIVFAPDDSAESIDILHVVSINAANGTKKRNGGKRKRR